MYTRSQSCIHAVLWVRVEVSALLILFAFSQGDPHKTYASWHNDIASSSDWSWGRRHSEIALTWALCNGWLSTLQPPCIFWTFLLANIIASKLIHRHVRPCWMPKSSLKPRHRSLRRPMSPPKVGWVDVQPEILVTQQTCAFPLLHSAW